MFHYSISRVFPLLYNFRSVQVEGLGYTLRLQLIIKYTCLLVYFIIKILRVMNIKLKDDHLWKVKVKSLSCVHLFVISMDCSLPGFSVHGNFQQEYWSGLPFPSPGGSFRPRGRTWVSRIAGWRLTLWASREAQYEVWEGRNMRNMREEIWDYVKLTNDTQIMFKPIF